jgi:hypothetical protein
MRSSGGRRLGISRCCCQFPWLYVINIYARVTTDDPDPVNLGAGVPMTSPLLYSAGHTDDTRQALMYIAQKFPKAPLLGLGFSLGSNVITRYLAEEGTQARLHAACALACVSFRMVTPLHKN